MLHVQPAPLTDDGMRPGGTLSIKVTAPAVEEPPLLRTVKV